MTTRLSMSSLAGTERTLVAVGTPSEASMFVTTRAAGPRSTVTVPSGGGALGAGAVGAGVGAGASAPARWGRGRLRGRGRDRRRGGRLGDGPGARPVVREEVPPRVVDTVAVGEVLLVELVDEPLVGAERRQGVGGRGRVRHGSPLSSPSASTGVCGRDPLSLSSLPGGSGRRPRWRPAPRSAHVGAHRPQHARARQHHGIRGQHESARPPDQRRCLTFRPTPPMTVAGRGRRGQVGRDVPFPHDQQVSAKPRSGSTIQATPIPTSAQRPGWE